MTLHFHFHSRFPLCDYFVGDPRRAAINEQHRPRAFSFLLVAIEGGLSETGYRVGPSACSPSQVARTRAHGYHAPPKTAAGSRYAPSSVQDASKRALLPHTYTVNSHRAVSSHRVDSSRRIRANPKVALPAERATARAVAAQGGWLGWTRLRICSRV